MITTQSIEEVKYRAEITEVIAWFIQLKKNGADYESPCPFHNEKTPSFKVSKAKGLYKCFGCGKGGDAIDFVMSYKNINYIDAIRLIADKLRINLEEEKFQQKKTYTRPNKKENSYNKPFIKWFSERGISENTLKELKVSHAIEWMPKSAKEIEVTCFNYYIDGNLINTKFRGDNKEFKLVKDAELVFYNLDSISNNTSCIITEGEIDCLTLHECGIKKVISVPNGAGSGQLKLEYLDNCWEYFNNITEIVIMTDNDEPGIRLREELARRLGKERCFKVSYPDECKDINDVLLKYGKSKVVEVVKDAVEFPIDGILTMDDMYEDVTNYYLNGYPNGTKVGIEGLDDYISFMPGQLSIITGIPGSGKSEFLDFIMAKAAINHGWNFAVCSFENQPSSLHVTKLMEKISCKSFAFRQNPQNRISIEELQQSALVIQNYFSFININQIEVTLDGILDKAKELVLRRGIKALVIDPWNYIEHKVAQGQTETQYVSECLTKMKSFSLTQGIHIFLIAHPTKLKKEGNKYEIPTMYSISGSAHFFNKTDNGITIYRDFATNVVDIYIQKIRYSWLGKIGNVSYNYNIETRQYELVNN